MIDWTGRIKIGPVILDVLASGPKTTAEIAAEMSRRGNHRVIQKTLTGSVKHLVKSGRAVVVGTSKDHRGGIRFIYALADPEQKPKAFRVSSVTTDDDLKRARDRHEAGESWDSIAQSLGLTRNCIRGRIERMEDRARFPSRKPIATPHFACVFEARKPREIRRINKPDAEIAALAREFAAGNISRAEFVLSIRVDR